MIIGKDIKVIGEDQEFFQKFMKHASPHDLEALESKVAALLKIPAHQVVIVPTLTPWRFVPEDILYHDNGKILSLKDTQKEYFDALRYEMNDYMAVRVCIIGDREIVFKKATSIYNLISNSL